MPIPPVVAGAALTAGAGLLGHGITSAFNIHESRKNRRFQRDMSNSEVQRRVRDLRAAGVNPLLAVHGGGGLGGASTPHSAAGQVESPRVDPLMGAQLMESRARTAQHLAETGKLKSETNFNNESMADRLNFAFMQVQEALQRKNLGRAEEEMLVSRMVMIEQEFEKLKLDTQHSALDLDRMRAESSLYKTLGGFGAAGKAGLLRIPGAALGRAFGARRGAGRLKGSWKRLNTKTGELRD